MVWYRDTNSLCYDAQITVSSGNGSFLNDFMLLENEDLVDPEHMPYDGVWIPGAGEKQVTVTFPEARDVTQVRLYDHPSLEHNVLAGTVLFPDGSEVQFGPLDETGAAMTIQTDRTGVAGFTVVLTETEGDQAGLTEVEAFTGEPDHGLRFLKLMDGEGNFVYDYWIPSGSEERLSLYGCGITREEMAAVKLSWDNQKCWAEFENGALWVICPEGKTMTLTVSIEGTDISDTVRIHNPGRLTRFHYWLSQLLEEQVFQKYCDGAHRNSAAYKLLATAADLIRS